MKGIIAIAIGIGVLGIATFTIGLISLLNNNTPSFPSFMAGEAWTFTFPDPIPEGYQLSVSDLSTPEDCPKVDISEEWDFSISIPKVYSGHEVYGATHQQWFMLAHPSDSWLGDGTVALWRNFRDTFYVDTVTWESDLENPTFRLNIPPSGKLNPSDVVTIRYTDSRECEYINFTMHGHYEYEYGNELEFKHEWKP